MRSLNTLPGTLGFALLLAAGTGCAARHNQAVLRGPTGAANRVVDENVLQTPVIGADRIAREVRQELLTLPYYGVFDNLAYHVNGDTVILYGQVTQPSLRNDAAQAVQAIPGVSRVDNQIQVLPLSSADDQLRLAEYRAIYGQSGLDHYALQAIPPIHIIVNNGAVTLDGTVSTQADRDLAGIRAKAVPGVLSVTNNLTLENR